MKFKVIYIVFTFVLPFCFSQRNASLPLSEKSFRQILRTVVNVPKGRSTSLNNIIIRHYRINSTTPVSYSLSNIKRLISDSNFVLQKPTVLYAHGYVELATDDSVLTVIRAYQENSNYNILLLDWSNLAFGNYVAACLSLQPIGEETGKAVWKLLKGGLSLEGLHLVGHSLGVHLLGVVARQLTARGYKVPRLTGLDPAYPGFYPPLVGAPVSPLDAVFVDIIHTDGGGYGAPGSTGHADYWPNEGRAKQPGCLTATVPLTVEDFCSHWRSWVYWSESVRGGDFLTRKCVDYDTFLRGWCQEAPLVHMGLRAMSELRGNFYLRTAAKEPYALGERGAS